MNKLKDLHRRPVNCLWHAPSVPVSRYGRVHRQRSGKRQKHKNKIAGSKLQSHKWLFLSLNSQGSKRDKVPSVEINCVRL